MSAPPPGPPGPPGSSGQQAGQGRARGRQAPGTTVPPGPPGTAPPGRAGPPGPLPPGRPGPPGSAPPGTPGPPGPATPGPPGVPGAPPPGGRGGLPPSGRGCRGRAMPPSGRGQGPPPPGAGPPPPGAGPPAPGRAGPPSGPPGPPGPLTLSAPPGGRGAPGPGPLPPSRPGPPSSGRGAQILAPGVGAPPVQPGKQTPRPGPAQPGAPSIGRGQTPPTGQMAGMTLSSPTTGTQPTTTKTPSTSEASQSKQASTVPSAVPTQSAPSAGGSGSGEGSGVGRGTGQVGVVRGTTRPQSYILTTRPPSAKIKVGGKGAPFNAYTNAFKIQKRPNWNLVQHRVDFKPEEDVTKMRKTLVKLGEKSLKGEYLFDGTMLFATRRLDGTVINVKDPATGRIFEITIREVGEVQPQDFSYIQLLNILMRKMMEKMELAQVDRHYFDPKAAVHLKEYKLELWPGYITSIRQHEQDMLLECEMKMKCMRMDSALDQIMTIYKANKADFKRATSRALIGTRIITKYNNRTYCVDDIMWDKNPETTFPDRKTGADVSFSQYFKQRYNLEVKDLKQPLLMSNPTKQMKRAGIETPVMLIPELCNMTGLTDDQRADFKLMKAFTTASAPTPPERIKALQRFSQRVQSIDTIKQELESWDLRFDPQPAKLVGRTLAPEDICTGKGKKGSYKIDNADWGGQVGRNYYLWAGVNCASWAIVYPGRDEENVKIFVNSLSNLAASMGLMFQGQPLRESVASPRTPDYKKALDNVLAKGVTMVVVVIPNNKSDAYAMVKKTCLIQKPTSSQVVTATVLKKWVPKGIQSVATKIAIQMACKLGGEPWTVPIPVKGLMVIGYDTWHDASQKGRSVGGVVATINPLLSRYVSYTTFHNNNEECIDKIAICVRKALKEYEKHNQSFPERVVVYRDGVGDGQIAQVKNMEVEKIKEAFKANNIDPKFTYVIVSKRINQRFYKIEPNGNAVNPPSGSIFDDVVTLPERYDFYLVSQSVRQGTVNPTSYNVIEDTSLWKPDILQLLTYKLTHLYYNWPGTVRVPMVCQYAHKLAYLVGESVHKQPAESLETLLYYL